jgi:hypothetical protein
MIRRPNAVTIIAWVYIATGALGFAGGIRPLSVLQMDDVFAEGVRLLAVVAGAFMLRRQNWARWLALAWMGAHVVLSAFHSVGEFAVHCLFFVVIAWFLFRPETVRYFRSDIIGA